MKNKSGTNKHLAPGVLIPITDRDVGRKPGRRCSAVPPRCTRAANWKLAEPLYRELLALQPDNGDALHLLGVLRYQQRDPAAAVPLIEAALKIIPGNIYARVGLGLALLRLNRFDEALDTFDRALAIKPDYAEALTRRGDALLGLGRQADALASYNRSLRYRPNDPKH